MEKARAHLDDDKEIVGPAETQGTPNLLDPLGLLDFYANQLPEILSAIRESLPPELGFRSPEEIEALIENHQKEWRHDFELLFEKCKIPYFMARMSRFILEYSVVQQQLTEQRLPSREALESFVEIFEFLFFSLEENDLYDVQLAADEFVLKWTTKGFDQKYVEATVEQFRWLLHSPFSTLYGKILSRDSFLMDLRNQFESSVESYDPDSPAYLSELTTFFKKNILVIYYILLNHSRIWDLFRDNPPPAPELSLVEFDIYALEQLTFQAKLQALKIKP